MSASSSPLELAIGHRLRRWRSALGKSRSDLARQLGEGEERIATYESGRVALRWEVFVKIWQRFALHPTWLATGEGSQMLAFDGFEGLVSDFEPKARFSRVYEDVLREEIAKLPKQTVAARAVVESPLDFDYKGFIPGAPISDSTPRGAASMEILASELPATAKESPLDDVSIRKHYADVLNIPPNVDALLDRVRAATAVPGSKKDLAAALGVRQQQLSVWLSPKGKRPSADYALALLKWLTGAEANQKKTPAELRTQPARKAQTRNVVENKPSSGPPRK